MVSLRSGVYSKEAVRPVENGAQRPEPVQKQPDEPVNTVETPKTPQAMPKAVTDGRWDKYIKNPVTDASIFSENEQKRAEKDGWKVPTNPNDPEAVRTLGNAIRNDADALDKDLVGLIINDPQRARRAIVNGNLTQEDVKRAYSLSDKIYAYNRTKHWLDGAEDFGQTYPAPPREQKPVKAPKEKVIEDEVVIPTIDVFDGYDNIFSGRDQLEADAVRAKVEDTFDRTMKAMSKRKIPTDVDKWDGNTRRMFRAVLNYLGERDSTAYDVADELIKRRYVNARLRRMRDNDYKEAVESLGGEDEVFEVAYKTLAEGRTASEILRDDFARLIREKGEEIGMSSKPDARLKAALKENVAVPEKVGRTRQGVSRERKDVADRTAEALKGSDIGLKNLLNNVFPSLTEGESGYVKREGVRNNLTDLIERMVKHVNDEVEKGAEVDRVLNKMKGSEYEKLWNTYGGKSLMKFGYLIKRPELFGFEREGTPETAETDAVPEETVPETVPKKESFDYNGRTVGEIIDTDKRASVVKDYLKRIASWRKRPEKQRSVEQALDAWERFRISWPYDPPLPDKNEIFNAIESQDLTAENVLDMRL